MTHHSVSRPRARLPERTYTCRTCGGEFQSRASGNKPDYCGPVCYRARRKELYKPRPKVDHPERPCEKCGESFKPLTRSTRFCKRPECVALRTSEKSKRHQKTRRGTTPRAKKDWELRKKYGLSLEDWEALQAKQGGRCAICSATEDLVVDHCHTSGKVRGALCRRCNLGIGYFLDDPQRLNAAARYLTTFLG